MDKPIPTIAIFTIVMNEKTLLPLWLKYYKPIADHILILDNDTVDGSTNNLDVEVKKVTCGKAFNHTWLTNTVMATQQKLLEKYDIVIFTEIDEFIVHTKLPLREAIFQLNEPFVRCTGFNIMQTSEDKVIDWNKPILKQRTKWSKFTQMDKTLITTTPLSYCLGFHHHSKEKAPNPNFLLIHLHNVDYEYARTKSLERSKYNWSQPDLNSGLGWQHHLTTKEAFDKYYKTFPITGCIPKELIERDLI